MDIREYEHSDLEFILHKMDGRYSKRREDKFRLVESSDAFFCHVAVDDSKVVGFIIMEDLGDGVSHYMVQINVAMRRSGIGLALVREVFDKIGPGGHISLCVNTDNADAIRFYEAMGFVRSGYTEGYRKGQDKFWYRKEI